MAASAAPAKITDTKITGNLRFLRWEDPWLIEPDCDFRPLFWKFAAARKDMIAKHDSDLNSYVLATGSKVPPSSEEDYVLEFKTEGHGIILSKPVGFGFSNVTAYLSDAMQRFNGREVTVEIDRRCFSLRVDPKEDVNPMWYTHNNDCAVSDEVLHRVCRPGPDACIFLTAGGGGFECTKFNGPMARLLLSRLADGRMNAKRIGNCKLCGRKEETK